MQAWWCKYIYVGETYKTQMRQARLSKCHRIDVVRACRLGTSKLGGVTFEEELHFFGRILQENTLAESFSLKLFNQRLKAINLETLKKRPKEECFVGTTLKGVFNKKKLPPKGNFCLFL